MAWLFGDGMGHYTTIADVPKKWTTYGVGNGSIATGAYARFSRSGIRFTAGAGSGLSYLSRVLAPTDPTTAYLGVCLKINTSLIGSGPTGIVQLLDATVNQVGLRVNGDGTLSVMRGDAVSGTLLGTSVKALQLGAYYFIELGVTIHASTGIYEVKVNNETWMLDDAGTANTRATANASWNQVRVCGPYNSFSVTYDVCDFYICDGSGPQCNGLLGDLRGDVHRPTADGAHTDWVPDPSVGSPPAHYPNVDDSGADDGDTTRVTSAVVDDVDSYVMQNMINAGATIHAIQLILGAKKSDAGVCTLAPGFRIGGVDYVSATPLYPSAASYAYLIQPYELSPAGSPEMPFDETEWNGAEVLLKKTS